MRKNLILHNELIVNEKKNPEKRGHRHIFIMVKYSNETKKNCMERQTPTHIHI